MTEELETADRKAGARGNRCIQEVLGIGCLGEVRYKIGLGTIAILRVCRFADVLSAADKSVRQTVGSCITFSNRTAKRPGSISGIIGRIRIGNRGTEYRRRSVSIRRGAGFS